MPNYFIIGLKLRSEFYHKKGHDSLKMFQPRANDLTPKFSKSNQPSSVPAQTHARLISNISSQAIDDAIMRKNMLWRNTREKKTKIRHKTSMHRKSTNQQLRLSSPEIWSSNALAVTTEIIDISTELHINAMYIRTPNSF